MNQSLQRYPWLFTAIAWLMMSLSLLTAWYSGEMFLSYTLNNDTTFVIMLTSALVLFPLSFLIANKNHNALVSAIAALAGGIAWGLFSGGFTSLVGSPNTQIVLTLSFLFSTFLLVVYTINSYDKNRSLVAGFSFILGTIPVIFFYRSYNDSFPTFVEVTLFLLIALFMVVGFEITWRKPHTWDNAIDFSAEFLADFISVPLRKLSQKRGDK